MIFLLLLFVYDNFYISWGVVWPNLFWSFTTISLTRNVINRNGVGILWLSQTNLWENTNSNQSVVLFLLNQSTKIPPDLPNPTIAKMDQCLNQPYMEMDLLSALQFRYGMLTYKKTPLLHSLRLFASLVFHLCQLRNTKVGEFWGLRPIICSKLDLFI